MAKIKKFRTLEEDMLLLQQEIKSSSISIAEIMRVLSGKGRQMLLILLSLPFCQPIQIPGLSTPFGLAIGFIGTRMIFSKRVWLPKKILAKTITPHTLEKITSTGLVLIRKIKPWIHPRLIWMCHNPVMESMHGLLILILGIFLALPLPIPFSNLIAAWSIFFIALGMLEDDGVLILIGYIIFVLAAVFFIVMALNIKRYLYN